MTQTKSKSCNNFDSFRIANIKNRIWGRSSYRLEFLRLGSKLFHLIAPDGKREFLKTLCFILIRGILLSVLVAYDALKFRKLSSLKVYKLSFTTQFIFILPEQICDGELSEVVVILVIAGVRVTGV